jgi:4-amino-4-deoxy-L-arabinose transferase-like glycosyltransferase
MKKHTVYQFLSGKGILFILLLAIVIRAAFFISLPPWNKDVLTNSIMTLADAPEYNHLALSVLDNKSFENYGTLRTPGYPVFIALIYSISRGSVWLVILIQILLSLGSVFIVYKIGLTIFFRKIALISAFIFAIDPHQALYTVELMSETLFIFFFLASIYYLCKSIKEYNLASICFSALFLGIATLVRPISYLFPLVAIVFILVFYNLKLQMRVAYSLIFSIIFFATISPWLIRNYSKYGEATLSSAGGYNLLFQYAAYTEEYKTGKTIEQINKEFISLAVKQGMDTTEFHTPHNSRIYTNIAEKYIKDNFLIYCRRNIMGVVNMYTGLATLQIVPFFHIKANQLNDRGGGGPGILSRIMDFIQNKTKTEIFIAVPLAIYLLINYLFSIYGIFVLIRKKEKVVYLFILIILYFSIIVGVMGMVRFKLPFMPIINILCAAGLAHYYTTIKDKFMFSKKAVKENGFVLK